MQTSCRKLVLATQHAPVGTGRLALLVGVWAGAAGARGSTGVGEATAKTARERKAVRVVLNCILAGIGYYK